MHALKFLVYFIGGFKSWVSKIISINAVADLDYPFSWIVNIIYCTSSEFQ